MRYLSQAAKLCDQKVKIGPTNQDEKKTKSSFFMWKGHCCERCLMSVSVGSLSRRKRNQHFGREEEKGLMLPFVTRMKYFLRDLKR